MPRERRIVIPGAQHHVTIRGNNRQEVFFTPNDREIYLRNLRENAQRYGIRVVCYCLMTNHVHLLVVPEQEDSLTRGLGRTHLLYSQHINAIYRRSGHLWQDRFYSNPLDFEHSWHAAAYVELNPVRAGMVSAPWDYIWSSAAVHCGRGSDAAGVLSLEEWNREVLADEWCETLREIYMDETKQEEIRTACRKGRPLGN